MPCDQVLSLYEQYCLTDEVNNRHLCRRVKNDTRAGCADLANYDVKDAATESNLVSMVPSQRLV